MARVLRESALLGGGAPLLPRRIDGLRLTDVHRNGQFAELTYAVQRS